MNTLRRLVVAVLLGVWCFPAISSAAPRPTQSAEVGLGSPTPAARPSSQEPSAQNSAQNEGAALEAREKQSQDLQSFRGGGVSIYIGSGALLVLVIVLLIILL